MTQRWILKCGAIALVIGLIAVGVFRQMRHRAAAPAVQVAPSSSSMAISAEPPSIPESEPLVEMEPLPPSVDPRSPALEKALSEPVNELELPAISAEDRRILYGRWQKALARSLDWEEH